MSKINDPCVLCKTSISANAKSSHWMKGNNAEPLAKGQCCDVCNDTVIYARLSRVLNGVKVS